MPTRTLTEILQRAQTWPSEAQEQLVEIALDIDEALHQGVHHPTARERAGIEDGLADAKAGRFVSAAEIEAAFARYRPA